MLIFFSVEIENNNSKNLIISGVYEAPYAEFKLFKNDFKGIVLKDSPSNKSLFLTDDININLLDYSTNSIVRQFVNLSFQNGLTPLINRPTRFFQTSAKCIDQILTNISRILK